MKTKEQILAKNIKEHTLYGDEYVFGAMEDYAEEIAIEFANFIKDNHYTKDNNERWYKYREAREELKGGAVMILLATEFFTTKELFELFKNKNQQ